MRKTVYFIGDSYRGGQGSNIRKLFEALSPVITSLGVKCSPVYSRLNESNDGKEWFDHWIGSLKGECESVLKGIDLSGAAVVGFELAGIDRQYLSAARIPWISLEIHPLRFLEDLYFDAEASFSIDYSLLAEPQDYIWLRARHLRTKYESAQAQPENRLLIIGQSPGDKASFFDGTFRNLSHYFDQLDEIAAHFESVDYRAHPYITDLETDAAVRSRYLAGACEEQNIYKVLASGRYRAVAGISSSVLREAPFFGLQPYVLEPRARNFGPPVSYKQLLRSREVWLSGLLETKLDRRPTDLHPPIPENHLRRVFFSWSYVSDEEEFLHSLASLDRRVQDQEVNSRVVTELARANADQQTALQLALDSVRDAVGELRSRLEQEMRQAAASEEGLVASLERAQSEHRALVDRVSHHQIEAQRQAHDASLVAAQREGLLRNELAELRKQVDDARQRSVMREQQLLAQLEEAQSEHRALVDRVSHHQIEAQRQAHDASLVAAQREGLLRNELAELRKQVDDARQRSVMREQQLLAQLEEAQSEHRALVDRVSHHQIEAQRQAHDASLVAAQREGLLRNELAELRKQVDDARQRSVMREQQLLASINQAMSKQSEHIAHLRAALDEVRASWRWRLTAPLTILNRNNRRVINNLSSTVHDALPAGSDQLEASPQPERVCSDIPQPETEISAGNRTNSYHILPMQVSVPNENPRSSPLDALWALPAEAFIDNAYRLLLNRAPDYEGMRYYLNRLRGGVGRRTVLAQIASSPERARRHDHLLSIPDDAAFITAAYRTVLGREPDSAGFQHYSRFLHRWGTRQKMLADLAASPEAQALSPHQTVLEKELVIIIAETRRSHHWLWRWFGRTDRLERQINRLELAFAEHALLTSRLEARLLQAIRQNNIRHDLHASAALDNSEPPQDTDQDCSNEELAAHGINFEQRTPLEAHIQSFLGKYK